MSTIPQQPIEARHMRWAYLFFGCIAVVSLFVLIAAVDYSRRADSDLRLLYKIDARTYGMTPDQVDAKVAEIEKAAGVSHHDAVRMALTLSGYPDAR